MRSILVATLLAATVMAGCAGTPDVPTDDVDDLVTPINTWITGPLGELEAAAWNATLPIMDMLVFTDRISGEPTVGVTRGGSIWYASIDFDSPMPNGGPRTIFYRSQDNGTTWEDKSPQIAGVATHPQSGDPYVYVDPTTGRVFALDMGPSVACNKVSWSDDDGETWMTRDLACPFPVADHPTLFAGPATPFTNTALYPNMLYLCSNQIVQAKCAYSPDGGLTWGETGLIYEGVRPGSEGVVPGICSGFTSHGHVSWADGTVYVPRSWCGEPYMAVSRDGGLTFTRQSLGQDPMYQTQAGVHDVMVAADNDGTAYAFWIGEQGATAFLSISRDSGRTWETPMNVTAPGVTAAKMPGIVAGDAGRISFMYIGTETPSGWELSSMEDESDEVRNATWNAYVGFSINADDEMPVFATTTANPLDQPIKRGKCVDRCFGTTGGLYDFLDIEMNPMDGTVYLALVDICTGECDEAGANADVDQISKGALGRQLGGPKLLLEPMAERTTIVAASQTIF